MASMDSGAERAPTWEAQATALETSWCPVNQGSSPPAMPGRARSRADQIARTVLGVREQSRAISVGEAHQAFQHSMIVSAMRCTLTYLVLPIVLPLIGLGVGVGPAIGIAIGIAAIVCNVVTLRRFFMVEHRRRWLFAGLISGVMVLLVVLLVHDITRLT